MALKFQKPCGNIWEGLIFFFVIVLCFKSGMLVSLIPEVLFNTDHCSVIQGKIRKFHGYSCSSG